MPSGGPECPRASVMPQPPAAPTGLAPRTHVGSAGRDHPHRDHTSYRPADPAPVARRRPRTVRRAQRRPRGDALFPQHPHPRTQRRHGRAAQSSRSMSAAGDCGPSRSRTARRSSVSSGCSQSRSRPISRRRVEVGWRLAREHWGRGYAPEGARAAVDFAFHDLGRDELVSMTTPANLPSQRVMQKLGMTRDPADDFDHPTLPDWEHRRHILYRLRSEQWNNASSAAPAAPSPSSD